MGVKALIFDLDDTMYCEHDYVRSGFHAVASFLSKSYKGFAKNRLYCEMVKEWELNGRGSVFNTVSERLGIKADIAQLVSIYRKHEPTIELYPDAEKLLAFLEQNHMLRGLITDGNRLAQWKKIKALGLEARIPCIIVTDDLGQEYWKPSEVPYINATKCLGVQPSECVYVGDNPNKDFVTAKKLGMHTIRIIREIGDYSKIRLSTKFEADILIHDLSKIDMNELK
jgi:putative hydrolase of the HAD superfamily